MRSLVCALIALSPLSCLSTAALARSMGGGHTVVMGEGNLYYNHDEKLELLKAVGAIALDALLLMSGGDEEEDWEDWDVDLELASVPLSCGNFGARISHFVSSGLALGGRLMYQINSPDEAVQSIWGVGPELTYYWREPDSMIRPFLSVGTSYARGRVNAHGCQPYMCTGYSFLTRGGLATGRPGPGFYVQTSYQRTRLHGVIGLPVEDLKLGIGAGVAIPLD